MGSAEPVVSVVIPTFSRASLVLRAARSALAQTVRSIEVIVVVDGAHEATSAGLEEVADPRLTVATLPRRAGLAAARNAGVARASGKWVSFLDDDDEWLPAKLERQLQSAERSSARYPIVACRLVARSETADLVWPRRPPKPNEPIFDYLFCGRTPFWGEGLIHPSTIFTARELAERVRFDRSLGRHEDLDWIVRASAVDGVAVEFVPGPKPLAVCHVERDRARFGNAPDWRQSLGWMHSRRHLVTSRAYAGFLLTGTSRSSARARHWSAFAPLLRAACRHGSPRAIDLLSFLGIWLIPQAVQRGLAGAFGRRSQPPAGRI